MGLEVGDIVPDFIAKNDLGEDFNSKEWIGHKPIVIYFYPKNFTPGCIKEACDFRDSYADFIELGVEVIGVSSDSINSHKRFKDRYKLPFPFLSDSNGALKKIFGIKTTLLGILPGRETFVIDQEGIVRLKFNSMNASRHLQKAISTVKKLMHS
ncbi:peroxiredoxin [Aquimarina sp. RZ0]|uniref:peroxiredoxin n=1 Tax=Aquimarina sp. RZ0 TaxID=2607730 RepID=UPI0011F242C5|nr:peroxiredoxin [Aquimarina sp. RZ0]KAA1242336.1 peroxiredoxin [Aquimarina sp. RZ0]